MDWPHDGGWGKGGKKGWGGEYDYGGDYGGGKYGGGDFGGKKGGWKGDMGMDMGKGGKGWGKKGWGPRDGRDYDMGPPQAPHEQDREGGKGWGKGYKGGYKGGYDDGEYEGGKGGKGGKKGGKRSWDDDDDDPNICRDYKRGMCTRGQQCRYTHVGDVPQTGGDPVEDEDGRIQPIIEMSSDKRKYEEVHRPRVAVLGSFAAPPEEVQAAIDLEEEEDPLSDIVSDILGLSEIDIASMSAEELIIHVERRIRATRAKEDKYRRGEGEDENTAQSFEIDQDDLPPLPPLPPVKRPVLIGSYRVQRVYKEITVVSELLAEKSREAAAAYLASLEDDLAVVIFRVLREAGILNKCKPAIGFPPIETPQLPRGYNSWIVAESAEEKAQRLKKERDSQEQKEKWEKFCRLRHKIIGKLRTDPKLLQLHEMQRLEARYYLLQINDLRTRNEFLESTVTLADGPGVKLAHDLLSESYRRRKAQVAA